MVRHSPQEVADFFGVYVAQDNEGKQWNLFADKPQRIGNCWYAELEDGGVDYGMDITDFIDVSANHDWRTLYEPHTHEKTHEKRMDNAPHQSEVHTHREYIIMCADNRITLEQYVIDKINHGWELSGGIAVDKGLFYQTIVRGV